VVDHGHRGALDGEEAVGVEAAEGVPEGFASAVAVDRGPGDDRPAVVELPEDRAHAVRHERAEAFDAEGEGAGLVELGQVVPVVEGGGRGQVVAEAAHQLAVAVDGLLVVEDEGGVGGQVAGDGAAEGGVRGRALEAELGDEPGRVGGVVAVVLPVPDVPDVNGAGGRVLRRVGGVGGEGAAGDV